MTEQAYQQSKPWVAGWRDAAVAGCGAAAPAGTPMASRTTAGRSFLNDHGISWPMGTGDLPSG